MSHKVSVGKTARTVIGLALATAIVGAWLGIHIYGVFFLRIGIGDLLLAAALVALETWLASGMFIVAHDAMHGSLSPRIPGLNRWVGGVALSLYAGFFYDKVAIKHHVHHRYPGSPNDPDFHSAAPRAFWQWYWRFFTQYFSLTQLATIAAVVLIYIIALHASVLNVLLFWALPSVLSSLQLFIFGTWLPHREDDAGFVDRHNARTLEYGWLASLAACYHFGYHIDHHRSPDTPWWLLPRVRSERRAKEVLA